MEINFQMCFFFFNFKELEDNKVLEKERERWE